MIARLTSLVAGATGWGLFLRIATLSIAVITVSHLVPVRFRRPGSNRASQSFVLPGWATGLIAGAAVLVGFAYLLGTPQPAGSTSSRRLPVREARPVTDRGRKRYIGVYEPGEFASYQPVLSFGSAIGYQPNIVLYYSSWGTPFETSFAMTARSHGAMTFVDMQPIGVPVAAIAHGRYDAYLRSYARQVRAYGHPVALSFAPEANGSWDKWGWTHTSPKTWVAAWRHIVDLFRQQHASNVTWVWVMNRSQSNTGPVSDYWPGSRYVGWVGIDGYYYKRSQAFQRIFAPTITAIRKFTNKPVILSETGIGQVAGQARKIPDLFAGIRRYHLIGLVWFDEAQHGTPFKQDWRLEGHRPALAAFRRGIASLAGPSG